MPREETFIQGSLLYYETKLLCPLGHGVKAVATVVDGVATLECGCNRGKFLPLVDGRISVEHLCPFASKSDAALGERFFPAKPDREKTAQRLWIDEAAW